MTLKQQRHRAKTLEDLIALAKLKGYGIGWAYAVYNYRLTRSK